MKENKKSRRNKEDMEVWLRDHLKRWRKMSLEEMEKDVTSRDGERCHLKRWRKMSLQEMEEDVT